MKICLGSGPWAAVFAVDEIYFMIPQRGDLIKAKDRTTENTENTEKARQGRSVGKQYGGGVTAA